MSEVAIMQASALGRVLVAEDDLAIAVMVCEVLNDVGYTVEQVVDGVSALEAVEAEPPQLLLLDVGLPLMGGDDVLQALRAAGFSHLPIVVTSASSDTVKYLGLGANAILPKPYGINELLTIVGTHIQGATSSPGSGSIA
jgi:DNA-binding response OmpR family regulator